MITTLFYRISVVVLLLAAGILVYIYYLLFMPIKVIVPTTQPYPVTDTTVQRGKTLTYIADYCKFIDAPAEVTRSFSDGLSFATPQTTTNLPNGCHKQQVTIEVPKSIPPGTYRLDIQLDYHLNPLRTASYHFKTVDFSVIRNENE